MIYALLLILLGVVYFFWKYPALRKTWYWLPRRGFTALMYHHIGPLPDVEDEQYPFTVTPEMFERQLLFLKQYGYQIISQADLLHTAQTGHTH